MKPELYETHATVSVDGKEKTLDISSGNLYVDVVIVFIFGAVIVGSFYFYGKYFGTREED